MYTPFYREIRPEGWERVPYWLDGLIPLAHLLGDQELIPKSDWNYGFSAKDLRVIEQPIADIPFSSKEPPLEIRCEMALIPYGCAKLRMTEMPLVK